MTLSPRRTLPLTRPRDNDDESQCVKDKRGRMPWYINDLILTHQSYGVDKMKRPFALQSHWAGYRLIQLYCVVMCLQDFGCADGEYTRDMPHGKNTYHLETQSHTPVYGNREPITQGHQLGDAPDSVNDPPFLTTVPAADLANVEPQFVGDMAIDLKASNSVYICTGGCNDNDSTSERPNITSTDYSTDEDPGWHRVMTVWLLVLASCGVVANTMTWVTLTMNGRAFSSVTVVLLKHQAIIDASVCALATGIFLQTSFHNVGLCVIDFVICFFWYSQMIYWVFALLSVWNLVFIAVDRYIAVCASVTYNTLSRTRIKIAIAAMYVCFISSAMITVPLVSFRHKRCVDELLLSPDESYTYFYWYSIYWLFFSYIVPFLSFLMLYGRIVQQLRRHRLVIAPVTQSQTVTNSTIRITKCAITVTCIFVMTISYHSIYFCMSSVSEINFDFGGHYQLIGMLMIACNSLANPFI